MTLAKVTSTHPPSTAGNCFADPNFLQLLDTVLGHTISPIARRVVVISPPVGPVTARGPGHPCLMLLPMGCKALVLRLCALGYFGLANTKRPRSPFLFGLAPDAFHSSGSKRLADLPKLRLQYARQNQYPPRLHPS